MSSLFGDFCGGKDYEITGAYSIFNPTLVDAFITRWCVPEVLLGMTFSRKIMKNKMENNHTKRRMMLETKRDEMLLNPNNIPRRI